MVVRVLSIFLLVCWVAVASVRAEERECAEYNGETQEPNTDENNGDCDFYDGPGGSCCNDDSDKYADPPKGNVIQRSTLKDGTECKRLSDGCKEMYDLFFCGISCSPNQGKFLDPKDNEVTVCKAFADRIYAACKDDETDNEDDDECVLVSDRYSDGSDMLTNDGESDFIKIDDDGFSDSCFNSAKALTAGSYVLCLAVFVASW